MIMFTTLKLKNLTRKQRVAFMLIQKFENEVLERQIQTSSPEVLPKQKCMPLV